jgi:hypothetical protein
MNTPAHVIAGLWAVGHGQRSWAPVVAGSLLPDLPMFFFYAWQRGWLGRPDAQIWSTRYFEADWQLFFDAFNSLPAVIVGLLVARWLGSPGLRLFFLSVGLHCVLDLLVHHDDAHRHFLPLTNWRFESPVSYWDPAHFGRMLAPLEAAFAMIGAALLVRSREPLPVRWLAGSTLAAYAAALIFAIFYFASSDAPAA